jgi:hypothetical protein
MPVSHVVDLDTAPTSADGLFDVSPGSLNFPSPDAQVRLPAEDQRIVPSLDIGAADFERFFPPMVARPFLPVADDYAYLHKVVPIYETSEQSLQDSARLEDFRYDSYGKKTNDLPAAILSEVPALLEARRYILDMRVPRVALEDFGTKTAVQNLRANGYTGRIISLRTFADGRKFVSKRFGFGDREGQVVAHLRVMDGIFCAGIPDAPSFAQGT